MTTLVIRFPARRYHATPWGHHVNEGLIEWPPSPWRLLRALLATGYSCGLWNEQGPPAAARSLVSKLAAALPRYRLPKAVGAHSRHFMPVARLKNGREETTLVFDTWAQVDSGALAVVWDVQLSPEESELLTALTRSLSYLGRSESWVEARLAPMNEPMPDGTDCYPCDESPPPGWEQISLMAAQDETTYLEWRSAAVRQALSGLSDQTCKTAKAAKKMAEKRHKAEAPYPVDLIACLEARTSWLRWHGWSQPPGSRRVLYWRESTALEVGAPALCPRQIEGKRVEAMLLSLTSASGNDHALPSVVRTLPQAELLHRTLVSLVTKSDAGLSEALIGRDEARKPLSKCHRHAHILPLDLDSDGHLEHVLIWAPMGLDEVAQSAVRAVRATFTKGAIVPLRLALVGDGTLDDLRGLPGKYGDGLRRIVGPSGGSKVWRSLTPFVPPRHLKKHGRNTLEGQVAAELASRDHPFPALVRIISSKEDAAAMRQRHFVRSRRRGPQPPVDCGFCLQLIFETPVTGPICLGYGSHFGLGVFAACE